MKRWKSIGHFGNRIVYASGNKRKLVIPNYVDIYFETDKREVWWHPDTGDGRSTRLDKVERNE